MEFPELLDLLPFGSFDLAACTFGPRPPPPLPPLLLYDPPDPAVPSSEQIHPELQGVQKDPEEGLVQEAAGGEDRGSGEEEEDHGAGVFAEAGEVIQGSHSQCVGT